MHVNFTKQFSVKQPKLATAFANVDLYPPVKDHMEGNVIHLCLSFIEKNSCQFAKKILIFVQCYMKMFPNFVKVMND